jgi:carbon storage regulator CsrA
MLVLSRCKGEEVIIRVGKYVVRVMVCNMYMGQVRLGFDAPLAVSIDRAEVDGRKQSGAKA